MKQIFSLSLFFACLNMAFAQLTEAEKKQAEIIKEGILNANAKERADKAAAKLVERANQLVLKGVNDTLVTEANYESDFYNNLEHISFEVKDGVMYAKYKADLTQNLTETQKIDNYRLVAATARTISTGTNKIFVYATPATKGKYLSTGKWGWSIGLLTVPFKIRPATGTVPSESKADIKNINIFIGRNYLSERIFWNQRTSSHRWLFGVMGGLTTETLTNLNTNESKFETNPTNQAYLTVAGGIGYSYKEKISVVFIPVGFDTGFSDTSKKWIYNGNYWWGLGIGLDFSNIFHIF